MKKTITVLYSHSPKSCHLLSNFTFAYNRRIHGKLVRSWN